MIVLLLVVLIFALQFFTPYWWWVIVVPLVYGLLIARNGWRSFGAGFLAGGLAWLLMSVYTAKNGGALVLGRVNNMLNLPPDSFVMILVCAGLGLLCGGFGALTGYLFKDLFRNSSEDDNDSSEVSLG